MCVAIGAGAVLVVLGIVMIAAPRAGIAIQRGISGVDQGRLVEDWGKYDAMSRVVGVLLILGGIVLGVAVYHAEQRGREAPPPGLPALPAPARPEPAWPPG
jgi:drug/metabolite transporter (DMT)-like permease